MSDPVDTDALREHARQEQIAADASRNQMRRADHDEAASLCRAAADEVDRLRAVIENAPHQEWCPVYPFSVNDKPGKCDCWKADAL